MITLRPPLQTLHPRLNLLEVIKKLRLSVTLAASPSARPTSFACWEICDKTTRITRGLGRKAEKSAHEPCDHLEGGTSTGSSMFKLLSASTSRSLSIDFGRMIGSHVVVLI